MKDYLKLLQFTRGHARIFRAAVFFMVLSTVFAPFRLTLLVPMTDRIFTNKKIVFPNQVPPFIAHLVDQLNAMDVHTIFVFFPIVVIGLMMTNSFVQFWANFFMNDISQRIMRDIRYKLYTTIQNFSLDYFSKKRTGELISRITNDVQVIENAVSYAIMDLFTQSFTIFFFVAMIFLIHFKAALIIFVLFPLIGVPMWAIGRRLRKLSKSSQEKMADINSLLLETISGVKVVKAFCMEKYETNRFKKQNYDFYKLKMKSIKRLLAIGPLTEFIGVACGMFLILGLGRQVMEGELSFGVFILFFGSIMSIISPIKKLANVHAITQQALAANERIYDILESRPTVVERPDARILPTIGENIKFDRVFFHYEEDSGSVLTDVNLEIRVGELAAIVGPTGTGKSTLVNLIPRFYDPTSGSVSIDGIHLKEVSFKSLRQQIGIVAQETILFNDTVRANIAYGNLDASYEEIEAAAQKAFAHSFIMKMPKGYETAIGDRGFRLSGGEKQRIAIARAILKNPPILILDEATSQLDSESEKFVQEALDELMKGRTVIAIAHRLSTIFKANKIVVLEQGRIIGLGSHDQLLATCGLYQRLYQTQFLVE